MLTPESLQDGVGTDYMTALLNRGKEGAQQTPALLSVVTAVTQRYFWDSGNSTWRSCDARSEAAHSCLSPTSAGSKLSALSSHLGRPGKKKHWKGNKSAWLKGGGVLCGGLRERVSLEQPCALDLSFFSQTLVQDESDNLHKVRQGVYGS